MREERTVWVEGVPYPVVLSDEKEALLAAQAAGRAVVGIDWGCVDHPQRNIPRESLPCRYVVDAPEAADIPYLERIVRRHLGLPWKITETKRLRIREFELADAGRVPCEASDREDDRIFSTPELLSRYIRCQYGFYEYGIWALVDRDTGELVGKAGLMPPDAEAAAAIEADEVTRTHYRLCVPCRVEQQAAIEADEVTRTHGLGANDLGSDSNIGVDVMELGYHIFQPYRGKGYAKEACLGILKMLSESRRKEQAPQGEERKRPGKEQTWLCKEQARLCKEQAPLVLYARTDISNTASIRVLRHCGFRPLEWDGEGGDGRYGDGSHGDRNHGDGNHGISLFTLTFR